MWNTSLCYFCYSRRLKRYIYKILILFVYLEIVLYLNRVIHQIIMDP
uniref:Uncharacterized protein n=1 Tax=Heterorhabditis bacteriophora TaxID=37862 RepID=A0A1I7WUN3_HETBA